MTKGTMNAIFNRYADAMHAIADDECIGLDAARLALALAMRDLADGCPPAHVAEDAAITAGIVERLERLVERHQPELFKRLLAGEFVTVDQALAVHFQSVEEALVDLRHELASARLDIAARDALRAELDAARRQAMALVVERDDLRQQLAQLDADNAALIRRNGNAPAPAPSMTTPPPAPCLLLPEGEPDLMDYVIGLDAGRHTWRTIPKPVRWKLASAMIRSIWKNGLLPSMSDFDASKPTWMPTASSVSASFGDGKWTVVCGKASVE